MPTKFSMTRDINGYNGFGLKPSDTNISTTLTINTDTTFTVPGTDSTGGCNYQKKALWLVIFSNTSGIDLWVAIYATAAVPAGATFAATKSMLNPAALELQEGDVIHCFAAVANVNDGIRFYSLT